MPSRWPIPTQSLALAAMLLAPTTTYAQAGRTLASPRSTEIHMEALGRGLDTPALDAPALDPLRDWALDISAVSSLPISIGVEVQLESPVGVFGNLSLGHTPSAYLEMVDALLQNAGVYGDNLDPLIQEATGSGAWNVRLGVGVRPIEGLELSVGYTYLHVSTSLRPETIAQATGQRFRWRGMTEVPMTIDVHALHGRIGWRFVIEEHVVLRAAIGWTHSVSVGAHLEVPDEVRAHPNDPATQIEDAVGDGFGTYGFTPEIVLGVGYRF